MIDGDQILALIAQILARGRPLAGGGVVATVMSNLGLERFLAGQGLDLHRTNVGDRYVVERMRADGFNVGGEQSGHMILSDYATTGDGLIAALAGAGRAGRATAARPARSAGCSTPCRSCCSNVRFAGPVAAERTRVSWRPSRRPRPKLGAAAAC